MTNLVMIFSRDADFYMLMSHILAASGFRALLADDLEAVLSAPPRAVAAILIDSSDQIDGLTRFCGALKAHSLTAKLPIVALIRARHEETYLTLLKAGINEGFVRPVSPERILAYLHALPGTDAPPQDKTAFSPAIRRFGDIDLEEETRLVRSGQGSVHLSPIEFRLLARLLKTPGHVVSRAELIETAWPGHGHVSVRTVDVHIANLRRAIASATDHTRIRTIRSSGYVAVGREAEG